MVPAASVLSEGSVLRRGKTADRTEKRGKIAGMPCIFPVSYGIP